MPKKPPKNAFFYFLIDFREEEKKKGIIYENLKEVQRAADPAWRASSAAVRAKYDKLAQGERARYNIPQEKYTTKGVPFSQLENQERLAKEASDRELKFIQDFVFQNSIGNKLVDKNIYLFDVNAFCDTSDGYVFGEFTVIRFNIRNGIIDHTHMILNPPKIPIGYASDIRLGCQEFALEVPDPDAPKSDYLNILAHIVTYLKENDPNSNVLPPMFTIPEKQDKVLNFISQLCHATLEDEEKFRVYKLDLLFFYIINTIKTHNDEGFPKESLAMAALKKDAFKYTPGIGCKHHEAGERPTECTQARATRWAFTILDCCCPVAGIQAVPGQHLPAGIDLEAVLVYKEKKMEGRPFAHTRPPSSSSRASSAIDMYETPLQSTASWVATPPPRVVQRVLPPLRRPTIETLNFQSSFAAAAAAPELSNVDFPPLRTESGSARDISAKMQNMNLYK